MGRDDKKGDGMFDKPLHWVNMQILDHRYAKRYGWMGSGGTVSLARVGWGGVTRGGGGGGR